MYRPELIVGETETIFNSIRLGATRDDEGCLIALKCQDCVFCIRGKQDFDYLKRTSRVLCPKTCILY